LDGITLLTTCDAPAYPSTPPAPSHGEDDLAALVYTSGSTGTSKGVMLTHRNLLAAADSICEYLEMTADDVILNALPLAFTYGLGQITTAFCAGATVVLERSSEYPRVLVETLVRERVTGFPIVPTIATLLLQQDLTTMSFPHLRYITSAAAALSNVKIRQLRQAFPAAKLYSMYGQTECQRASYLPPDQIDVRPASVGVAIPGTSVWIVDAEGNRVAPGGIGHLCVERHGNGGRGPEHERGERRRPDHQSLHIRRRPPNVTPGGAWTASRSTVTRRRGVP
jgi:acyl-CoA synthetase (AMP-forming)/AMP-acid ligase II